MGRLMDADKNGNICDFNSKEYTLHLFDPSNPTNEDKNESEVLFKNALAIAAPLMRAGYVVSQYGTEINLKPTKQRPSSIEFDLHRKDKIHPKRIYIRIEKGEIIFKFKAISHGHGYYDVGGCGKWEGTTAKSGIDILKAVIEEQNSDSSKQNKKIAELDKLTKKELIGRFKKLSLTKAGQSIISKVLKTKA